jgi:hypothetical protein
MIKAAALVLVGACSLTLQRPDPRRPWRAPPRCNTTINTVLLDGIAASALAVGGIWLANNNSIDFPDRHAGGVALGGLGALFALSAYVGSQVVDDCRAAMLDYALWSRTPP